MPEKSKEARELSEARLERARKASEDGAIAMAEHHAAARAVDEKTARLKSLRLAKELEPALNRDGSDGAAPDQNRSKKPKP